MAQRPMAPPPYGAYEQPPAAYIGQPDYWAQRNTFNPIVQQPVGGYYPSQPPLQPGQSQSQPETKSSGKCGSFCQSCIGLMSAIMLCNILKPFAGGPNALGDEFYGYGDESYELEEESNALFYGQGETSYEPREEARDVLN
ncbi:uncharacterized protein [Parasteatoda tepidariorum]|uniref:uncharacterized protein isoform X1 n=1 Tax=Parasteatoda tepidariorum TaxID=114398 RepID=UPI0039BCFD71